MTQVPRLGSTAVGRRALMGALVGVVVAVLLSVLRGTAPFERVEWAWLDARTRTFVGQRAPDPRIVLAEVQEQDVEEFQRRFGVPWPWTEEILEPLPTALEALGARGLLIDVMYLDRGRDDGEYAEDDPMRQVAAAQRDLIGPFAGRLQAFGRVGAACVVTRAPAYVWPARQAAAAARFLPVVGSDAPEGPFGARGIDPSVRAFVEGVRWIGFANTVADGDGIVRRAAPVARVEERVLASLPLVGAALLTQDEVHVQAEAVRVGGVRQDLDARGTFLLPFPAPLGQAYPRVSPVALLRLGHLLVARGEDEDGDGEPDELGVAGLDDDGRELLEDLRQVVGGRLVIYGQNVVGAEDLVATPIGDRTHGPELLAYTVDVLLHGDGRLPWSRAANLAFLGLLAVAVGLLGMLPRGRLWPLVGAGAAALLVVGGGHLLFGLAGRAMDTFTPLVGIGVTAIATGTLRLLTEGRRNRWLEGTFSRYLAPDVIAALKRDPSRIELGGRRREITIFFSDVAGFTSLSERLEPEQVVRLLNRYLTGQSAELMERGGVIDKFEGDAIMAFFGDPLDVPDHAERACRSAVACIEALASLEPTWRELGIERFDIRIGINTGTAVVGNLGSERRFDYTCMGDAVNLASRLEGANKHFGSRILIGPDTYAQARDALVAKPLGDLVVVGKSRPVAVYELIAMADAADVQARAHVAAFTEAGQALRAGAWAQAREALAHAEAARPGDGPTAWLGGVLASCEHDANIRAWDGRVVLHSK